MDNEDGTVNLNFRPTVATAYSIRLTWHAQQTPTDVQEIAYHTVTVLPFVTSTRNCIAIGDGIASVAMAGVAVEFIVVAKDRFDNRIPEGGRVLAGASDRAGPLCL